MLGKQIQALCHGKIIVLGLPHQQRTATGSRCKLCGPSMASRGHRVPLQAPR